MFTDALVEMEKAMKRDKIEVNDRQVCLCDTVLKQLAMLHLLNSSQVTVSYKFSLLTGQYNFAS